VNPGGPSARREKGAGDGVAELGRTTGDTRGSGGGGDGRGLSPAKPALRVAIVGT